MGQQIVAVISIGQSPREDIIADFRALCGREIAFLDIGALDGLSPETIAGLAPLPGEADLVTKLRDGRVIYLSHHRLRPYLELALANAAARGAERAVIACTGDFPGLKSPIPVLLPNEVLAAGVTGCLPPGANLAVVVPTPGQAGEAAERWSKRGFEVAKVIVQPPFDGYDALIATLRTDAAVRGTQALVADCFGFGLAFGAWVAKYYDKPVFIGRRLIGHLLLAGVARRGTDNA